jgi:hypothetical protein
VIHVAACKFRVYYSVGPRVPMYSGSHSSPAVNIVLFTYSIYVMYGLKLYSNCFEVETGAALARLFPRGKVTEASITFGWERKGLVISVDQRHGTGINKYFCLQLPLPHDSSRFLL